MVTQLATRTDIGEVISSGEVSILDLQQVVGLPHISSPLTPDAEAKHLGSSSSKSNNSVLMM